MLQSVDEAREFHREVPVLDLHADTPMLSNVSGYDINARHHRKLPKAINAIGHVDVPRMRDGGVAGQIFGMWTMPYPEILCPRSIHKQLDCIDRAIANSGGGMRRCWTGRDVREAHAAGTIAALAGIEGGQALRGNPGRVEEFAARGVRYIGLLHFSANALGKPAYGKGAQDDIGLTAIGHEVIAEMNRLGVIVDLAHINHLGFYDAIAASNSPPMVSHTGVHGVHPHWRNIDDDQLRAIGEAGGCVGVIFARKFLGGKGIDKLCDHILHVIAVAGEDTAALGSDFDGFVVPPVGLEDVSLLPNLTYALSRRGLSDNTLAKLLGGNAIRVLDDVPPAREILGIDKT